MVIGIDGSLTKKFLISPKSRVMKNSDLLIEENALKNKLEGKFTQLKILKIKKGFLRLRRRSLLYQNS